MDNQWKRVDELGESNTRIIQRLEAENAELRSRYERLRDAVVEWRRGKNLTQRWDHYDAILSAATVAIEAEGE